MQLRRTALCADEAFAARGSKVGWERKSLTAKFAKVREAREEKHQVRLRPSQDPSLG
jgi:hypothetical protein